MTEFDMNRLRRDLSALLAKHDGIVVALIGFTYQDGDNFFAEGMTFIPIAPRDHEEKLLRDAAAKKVSSDVVELTKTVYWGR